jgi:hypothetical protein
MSEGACVKASYLWRPLLVNAERWPQPRLLAKDKEFNPLGGAYVYAHSARIRRIKLNIKPEAQR